MRRLPALLLMGLLAACQTAETPRPAATAAAAAAAAPAAPSVERTRKEANKDDAIKSVVARRIHDLDRRAFRAVIVESWGGRVLLMGAVMKPEQRRKAEQTAQSVEGVVEVLNELVLAEDKALEAFVHDPERETALRQRLGIEGRAGTQVRVVNGVAFLLGSAPADTAAAMKADASEVEGVKWVVSHIKPQAQ